MGLEEKALIRTEATFVYTRSGQKRNGSLLYTIRPIQEALDQFYERQIDLMEQAETRRTWYEPTHRQQWRKSLKSTWCSIPLT